MVRTTQQQSNELSPDSPSIVISDENTLYLTNSKQDEITSYVTNTIQDDKEEEILTVTITTPNFQTQIQKVFQFHLNEKVWKAKQIVLIEFANNPDLKDPLNFGFYMPPYSGRAGKFLDEERLLREYPMNDKTAKLEFRYKRRIFRHLELQDERKLQKMNTKKYRKKFIEGLLTRNYKTMEKLLQKGLDPNFHDEKSGDTPLIVASKLDGCMELLKLLVQYGAYINFRARDGQTALHVVAVIGKVNTLKNLLDLGASPNYKDGKGLTPLYLSITSGANPLTSEILLKDHAEVGVSDLQGSQEIHQACKIGNVQHLEHLIFYGADVNSTTASGNTPLHICGLERQENCARVLLFRGADRAITNYAQQSAYDVAILANNFEVAQLINEFDETQVKIISEQPEFSTRRLSKKNSKKSTQQTSNSLPTSPVSSGRLFHAVSTPNMHTLGLQRLRKMSASSLPDLLDEYSDSESDSDDDENLKPVTKGRTFSAAGIGTKRSPAPIKINPNGAATLRTRLYASVPGRHFVAVRDYEPAQPGELMIKKNDIVEVLYVGEGGYWEGCIKGRGGWFPSFCVQEVKKGDTFKTKNRSWFGNKKNSPMEVIGKAMITEPPKARVVPLRRSDKGFGFQLRGANSHVPHIEFAPSPQFPALQYIGEVDKNGVAEKAGLRPGDFVLEINNEDVTNATHGYAVSVISQGGPMLTVKVITVAPESLNPDLSILNGTTDRRGSLISQTSDTASTGSQGSLGRKVPPPPPPMRANSTVLTQFRPESSEHSVFSDGAVAVTAETVVLEKPADRKTSSKGMWAGTAYKLQGNNRHAQDDNIATAMSKKQNGPSHALAAEFDEKFKLITKQVNADVSLYPPVQPKPNKTVSRGSNSSNSSSSSTETEKPQRKPTPPGYDYTLESLRRGRANSLGKGDQARPVSMLQRSTTVDLENRYDRKFQEEMNRRNTYDPRYRSDPRLAQITPDPRYRDQRTRQPISTDPRLQDPRYRDPRLQDPRLNDPRIHDPRLNDPRLQGKINRQSTHNEDDMAAYQYRRNMMVASYIEDQKFNSLRRPPSHGSTGNLPQYGRSKSRPVSENFDRHFRRSTSDSVDPKRRSLERKERRQETVLEQERKQLDKGYRVIQEIPVNELGHDEVNTNSRSQDQSTSQTQAPPILDGLVRLQNQRLQHVFHQRQENVSPPVAAKPTVISVHKSAIPPPPPTPPPMPPPPDYEDDIIKPAPPPPPPPPPFESPTKPKGGSLNDSILNAVQARSQRVKKDSDSDSIGSLGKTSLYNSSSSVSLDSAGSKDSGFDNDGTVDHSSALAQAIALRAAKMAAKDTSTTTITPSLPITKEVPEQSINIIEETRLLKPSQMKSKDLNPTEIDKGYSSPTSRPRTKSDIPPITKPKPKRSATMDSLSSPDHNNNRSSKSVRSKSMLSEDSATSFLDGVIADAEASIDYDLISITSNSSNGEEKIESNKVRLINQPVTKKEVEMVDLPPPPPDDLPPPPIEFLDDKEQGTSHDESFPEAPPPYTVSAPTIVNNVNVPQLLITKPFTDWDQTDVCSWLDYLQLSQYKITFSENDIIGKHLTELTKDELKELGITKLGHRMTLDDAISKLCRKDCS